MIDFQIQLKERTQKWASLFLDWAVGGRSERVKQESENQGMNKEDKAKKMKKSRGGDDDYDEISSIIGDEILCEILSRFPVKSLMQFKCVCKRWKSLIEEPYFAGLHFNRSEKRPSLLISLPMEHGSCFFSADLFEGGEAIPRRMMKSWRYPILNSVNGLVCFVRREGSVQICNPSTQEVTPWIDTTTKTKKEEEHGVHEVHQKSEYLPLYGFGFDPSTKEHKVICIWVITRTQTFPDPRLISVDKVCEVLTVGDNSWRRINEVPPHIVSGLSVFVNGSIYWRNSNLDKQISEPEVIVAFDVGSEKFRVIPIPNFILDYRISFGASLPLVDLLEVDGHLALLARLDGFTVKLWIFNDDKEKGTTSTSWTEETISMSFDWVRERHQLFQPIEGTDEIIIKPVKPIDLFSLYYYNRKKKTFRKVDITGICSFTNPDIGSVVKEKCQLFQFKTFVESLLRVQK